VGFVLTYFFQLLLCHQSGRFPLRFSNNGPVDISLIPPFVNVT